MDLPAGVVEGEQVTCGYVTVPEARARPGGGEPGRHTIRLAAAVTHSANDDPMPDPLVMLAFLDDPAQAPDAGCLEEMPGLAFRLPVTEIVLESFTDEERGFRDLVPAGWQEHAPANLVRASSATDPAYFVLEAQPVTAAELFSDLAGKLGLDPGLEPTTRAEIGSLTWDLYAFEILGYPGDCARYC